MMKSIIERGRSMVEMLGVLAVMGVLSVAGLAGYNFAMKKHVQNELKNELAMRAIAVSSQMLAGQRPSLDSFSPDVGGYAMQLSAAPSASAFGTSDYLDEETNEPLNFTEVTDPNPEDKEFAIGIDGLPADLVEWFLQLAQQAGIIQRIVDSTGTTLTTGQDWQHAAVYGGKENKAGNTYNIYIIFASDLAQKKAEDLEKFVGKNQCNDQGTYTYLPIYGAGCQCKPGYSGDKCSETFEACNGEGVWYDGMSAKMCLCKPGKTGVSCKLEAGNSPCQDEGTSEGKPCEQAGMVGKCSSGSCIASSKYYKCSTIDKECGEGYFCHYGDTESDVKTPNICEKVNADKRQLKGETYYVNTEKDLRSWCRAKNGEDCDWGFLAYEGALSWCAGLEEEARLLTKEELCSIKDHLPVVFSDQKYWAQGGKIIEISSSDCKEVTDKKAAAAVVCKKGSAIASALTAEERAFYEDMKEINSILNEYAFDGTELERVLTEIKDFSSQVISAYNANQLESFRSLKAEFNKEGVIEKLGVEFNILFSKWDAEIVALDAEIAELKKEIEELKRKSDMTLSFDWNEIMTSLFGIKTAYAETSGICSAPLLGKDYVDYLNNSMSNLANCNNQRQQKGEEKKGLEDQKECLKNGGTPSQCHYETADERCKRKRGPECKISDRCVDYIGSGTCSCPGEKCYCTQDEVFIEEEQKCCPRSDKACYCKSLNYKAKPDRINGRHCCLGSKVITDKGQLNPEYCCRFVGKRNTCCAVAGIKVDDSGNKTFALEECGCPSEINGIKAEQKGEICCYGEKKLSVTNDGRGSSLVDDPACRQPYASCSDGQESYNGTCCLPSDPNCICPADPENEICKDLVDVTRQVQQGCDVIHQSMWCLRT